MEDTNKWLRETQSRCVRLSEAYRLQLGRLWWVNLILVVVPAVCSTAAAVFAAIPTTNPLSVGAWLLPPASILAGLAAVLVSVHKALKCDEYQAECLRLSQRYQAVAEAALVALSRPGDEHASLQQRIAEELKQLTEGVRARLPTGVLRKAGDRFEDPKSFWLPKPDNLSGPIAAAASTPDGTRGTTGA